MPSADARQSFNLAHPEQPGLLTTTTTTSSNQRISMVSSAFANRPLRKLVLFDVDGPLTLARQVCLSFRGHMSQASAKLSRAVSIK